jgi:hypothetical protein
VPFKPLANVSLHFNPLFHLIERAFLKSDVVFLQLTRADFQAGFVDKLMGQIEVRVVMPDAFICRQTLTCSRLFSRELHSSTTVALSRLCLAS